MFEWLKRLFRKKEQKIPTIEEIHKQDNYETVEYHPNPKVELESQKLEEQLRAMVKPSSKISEQLAKLREEQVKKEFLPEPKTHRITHTHSYQPPAEQHRDAISKFMKGKASRRYLQTIKQSPKIKIEDDTVD